MNKTRNFIWIVAGILLMIFMVVATTTISDTSITTDGFIDPTLTTGSILFINGSGIIQNNAGLFWSDGANVLRLNAGSNIGRLTIGMAGETTREGIAISGSNAMTAGDLFRITDNSNTLTSGGLAVITHIASSITQGRNQPLFDFQSDRTIATALTKTDSSDTLYILRNSKSNNGAADYTVSGAVIKIDHQATQNSGTLTDSTIGLEISMEGETTGAAIDLLHQGVGVNIINIDGRFLQSGAAINISVDNGMTTGAAINIFNRDSGTNVFTINEDGNTAVAGNITIAGTSFLRLDTNTTAYACNVVNEGGIYFDTTENKHFGCDGSTWQALY